MAEKLWGTLLCDCCRKIIFKDLSYIIITKLDNEKEKLHYCDDKCRNIHHNGKNIKQIHYIK